MYAGNRNNELGYYVKIVYHQREIQTIDYIVAFENDINAIKEIFTIWGQCRIFYQTQFIKMTLEY